MWPEIEQWSVFGLQVVNDAAEARGKIMEPEVAESTGTGSGSAHGLFTVADSDELGIGRYLVAAKDIDARTLIICEKPMVCAPADDDLDHELGQFPMCLGCYKRMANYSAGNRCSKCGWPVCGPECETADYHAENECELFSSKRVTYPPPHAWPIINKSILVLRTLFLKKRCPQMWSEVILKLEHHSEIRRKKPYCTKGDTMIVENLKYFLEQDENFECDEDEIKRISGVINVNAFSSMKSDYHGNSVRIMQCMYPEASLLAHSCVPNCVWAIDNGQMGHLKMSIYSATPIKMGEMITIAYNVPETMSGTLRRLISTEDVAHFLCRCRRCADKTEVGTFVSAIKCFSCDTSYMLPERPTDADSVWKCLHCDNSQSVQKIVLFLSQIEEDFEKIKDQHLNRQKEVKKLEVFLKTKEELLHQNHYILQEARMKLINLQVHFLEELEDEGDVDKFTAQCRIMLGIADVLCPGFSKMRAMLQFFLSQGLMRKVTLMRLRYDLKEEDDRQVQEEIEKFYREIQCLETRALLFFNTFTNEEHSGSSKISSFSGGMNQMANCIKRQLKTLENYV